MNRDFIGLKVIYWFYLEKEVLECPVSIPSLGVGWMDANITIG
jgi:hypothetical protein